MIKLSRLLRMIGVGDFSDPDEYVNKDDDDNDADDDDDMRHEYYSFMRNTLHLWGESLISDKYEEVSISIWGGSLYSFESFPIIYY